MATTEGLVLDSLDLNAGSYGLTALTLPIPRKRPEWIEGVDADGALLMRDPLVSNAQCVATLDVRGSSRDNAHTLIGAIVDKLEEADNQPGGIALVWTPANSTKSLTFYVLSGEVTELPVSHDNGYFANVVTVQITMDCRPGGYGAEIATTASATTAGPLISVDIGSVQGDMPSDEARVVITDMSTQSRKHVEWGQEWRYYNPGAAWPLIIDSDSLVTSGFAGAGTTQSGAYDPGAAGNNVIGATVFASPTAVCGTGSQTHVGQFRVKARVYNGSGTYTRLSWATGDGSYVSNAWSAPAVINAWSEIDLGLITIPQATAGTQSWQGRIDSYTVNPSGSSTVVVDYLLILPVGEGYGKARGETAAQAGVISAYDLFNQTAGALNTKTMGAGGAWATSGTSATDFEASGSGTAIRTVALDVGVWDGRFAIAGTTTYTGVSLHLEGDGFNPSGRHRGVHGLVARYVDASNWVALLLNPSTPETGVSRPVTVIKNIAGTKTELVGTGPSFTTLPSTIGPPGIPASFDFTVLADGSFVGTVVFGSAGAMTVTGSDATLATGGTLATGKTGFYSAKRSGPSAPYTFDNFSAAAIPSPAPAMYSTRTLEVTSSETRRQNSAGTIYGAPGSYRGSRMVLRPAGSAGRTTRVWGKGHRNDVELAAADQIADQIKVQVYYKPRHSVVPR